MATGKARADLLTDSALRELAGEKSYARGAGYFRSDTLARLAAAPGVDFRALCFCSCVDPYEGSSGQA